MPKNWSWPNFPGRRWRWTLMFLTVIAAGVLLNSATNQPAKITGKYKLPPDIRKAYGHMIANPPSIAPAATSSSGAPLSPGAIVLTLGLVIGWALFILRRSRRASQPYACLRCLSIGMPRPVYRGSAFFGCLFLCLFVVPWIFYTIWRANNRRFLCPVCGSIEIIPLSSPQGQRIAAAIHEKNNEATDLQQNTRPPCRDEPTKTPDEPTPAPNEPTKTTIKPTLPEIHENTRHYIT